MTLTLKGPVAFLCHLVVSLGLLCSASRASPAPAPPPFPARFDAPTVENLVRSADQGQNSSLLKVGYFARKVRHPLPLEDGYKIVVSALTQEPKNSVRWFALQSVAAFAAFAALRVGNGERAEGIRRYGELFDAAPEAVSKGQGFTLLQSIHEFTAAVSRGRGTLWNDEAEVARVTGAAWKAYTVTKVSNFNGRHEPDWVETFAAVGKPERFVPLVEETLANPQAVKTFGVYRTAVFLLSPVDPRRALKLLETSGSLLPADQPELADWLSGTRADLLVALGDTSSAVQSQKEYVKASGRGAGRLMRLLQGSGDTEGLLNALQSLDLKRVNASDFLEAVAVAAEAGNKAAGPDAMRIFTAVAGQTNGFLGQRPDASLASQLRIRLAMADALVRLGKSADAQRALVIGPVNVTPDNAEAFYWMKQVEKKRAEIGLR